MASTGVIGEPLPMPRVLGGIDGAGAALTAGGWDDFAHAILTTDQRAKTARREVQLGRVPVTLLGCTKGAGMIAPNMATTLTFVVTDAAIAPAALDPRHPRRGDAELQRHRRRRRHLDQRHPRRAGVGRRRRRAHRQGPRRLHRRPHRAAATTSPRQLMRDGEGVHHVVTIEVRGAASERAAAGAWRGGSRPRRW